MTSQGFDTTAPGAAAADWDRWASHMPQWVPPAGHIVIVAPHPDDESLGAGGLIWTCIQQGRKVSVISVTDGEAACPEVPALDQVRRRELMSALRELQLAPADSLRLGLPDGGVSAREGELAGLLDECISNGAVLIAPFEHDGHPDHESTGRACRAVAEQRGFPLARYPIWALHTGSACLREQPRVGRFMLQEPALQAKRRAIFQHTSQTQQRPGGAIVPAHVLRYFDRPYELYLL